MAMPAPIRSGISPRPALRAGRPGRLAPRAASSAAYGGARPRVCLRGLDGAHAAEPRAPGALKGAWGYGVETSKGKDTPSGPLGDRRRPRRLRLGLFPQHGSGLSEELTAAFIERGNLPGILGDKHASGTTVIDEYGAEHMRTGKPIFYTSVDSVLQIAAHEESFGLERLYELCRIGREICDAYKIGRVIARPSRHARDRLQAHRQPQGFRHASALDTILDTLTKAGRSVVTVGKIGDIFAHRSTG